MGWQQEPCCSLFAASVTVPTWELDFGWSWIEFLSGKPHWCAPGFGVTARAQGPLRGRVASRISVPFHPPCNQYLDTVQGEEPEGTAWVPAFSLGTDDAHVPLATPLVSEGKLCYPSFIMPISYSVGHPVGTGQSFCWPKLGS